MKKFFAVIFFVGLYVGSFADAKSGSRTPALPKPPCERVSAECSVCRNGKIQPATQTPWTCVQALDVSRIRLMPPAGCKAVSEFCSVCPDNTFRGPKGETVKSDLFECLKGPRSYSSAGGGAVSGSGSGSGTNQRR
jgi:hypothetical protein